MGLAPDGGLMVPVTFPSASMRHFDVNGSYPVFCEKVLQLFFEGDRLSEGLGALCEKVFNFDIPLIKINTSTYLLSLFCGPTLSFKDFGARFLAACMDALATTQQTLLVATSGDTGSAVACAFHGHPNIQVLVLFPQDQITKRQEQQIA